jgi:hypothetical protein
VKFKIVLITIVGCLLFSSLAAADVTQYYFKFEVQSGDQINKLSRIISIDNVDGLTVHAYASDEEFENFKRLGYRYEILPSPGSLLIPQMSADYRDLIADWDTYPTYQAYIDMMNQFAADYPSLCRIVNIGSSVQGRQLLFARISDNVDSQENEPEVMYSSTMHGDETTGYVLMLRLIDYLLSNYGVDPQVTDLVGELEIWINPLANPDGTYHGGNNTVNGAIRYNANGADLNRNFPDPAEGDHPDGRAWQSETIAMMDFFDVHNFVISANFHGGAEVVNYLWDTWSRHHADDSWLIDVSRAYAESCQAHSPSGYMTDLNDGITNGYAWYRVAGGRQDCITYFNGGREFTIELSQVKLLAPGQLPAHWDYNRVSFLNFLENALFGVRGVVSDSGTGLPLAAQINVLNHDIDSADVHTDADVGDYHRMLHPETYDILFSSPGYLAQVVNDITVIDRSANILNVQLQQLPNRPILSFHSHNAGSVDPGDMVSMNITLINEGGSQADDVVGILSSVDPYVTIGDDSSAYPPMPPIGGLATSISPYSYSVHLSCPILHEITFRLDITADGGYVDSAFFGIVVGRQIEDFESGDFSNYPWQFGGNSNWAVTSNGPFEGLYSAKSGAVGNNQRSEITLQIDVAQAGQIRFNFKVSSEDSYDFLKFYIDGILQDQWSGEIEWSPAIFDIAPGTHTLKWGYYKDGSVFDGSDCAWLDYIIFPPLVSEGPIYIIGDANGNGQANGIDVTFLVSFFKGGDTPPFHIDCPPYGVIYAACDVNGNCSVNGVDVTYLVAYFKGGAQLIPCPVCPPTGMAPGKIIIKEHLPGE